MRKVQKKFKQVPCTEKKELFRLGKWDTHRTEKCKKNLTLLASSADLGVPVGIFVSREIRDRSVF